MKFTKILATVAIACLATAGLAACSSTGSSSQHQQYCVQQLDPSQLAQAQQYQQQGVWQSDSNDVPQTICYIDSSGNERYVDQNENFSDYLMYAMLFGHANSLATYGYLSGNLSASDAFALSMLLGTSGGGSAYHPYACSGYTCQTGHSPYVVHNHTVVVHNVYYGATSTKAVPYKKAVKQGPPKAYTHTTAPGLKTAYQAKAASASKSRAAKIKLQQKSANNGGSSKKTTTRNGGGGYKPPKKTCCKPAGGKRH